MRMRIGSRGFTLLELAIVLALIGIITGDALLVLTATVQSTQFNTTVSRMDAIDNAILNFATINYRIPCPGDLTQNSYSNSTTANTLYGVESANQGSCRGGTPAATYLATSGTVEGSVPTRALQLPDDYMYDGWGHRFRYAVDPIYTVAQSLPVSTICNASQQSSSSAISVSDGSGGTRTSAGAYALVSHGANGHGAFTSSYTSAGGLLNASSTNTNEQTNCHCSSSAVPNATYTPTYVAQAPAKPSSQTNFDDIVTFREAWQLQAQNFPLLGNCLSNTFVEDYGLTNTANTRISGFTSGGVNNFYTGSGCNYFSFNTLNATCWCSQPVNYAYPNTAVSEYYIYTNPFISPSVTINGSTNSNYKDLAVDAYGDIWVADSGNNKVQEFNSSNNYASAIMSISSGLSAPTFLAFDSNNYLWVADTGDNLVQKFSFKGPSAAPEVVASITYGSTVTGITTDSYNNIWIAGSASLQKYSSSGALLKTCNVSTFNGIGEIKMDPGNNIWALDIGNKQVQVLNNLCNYLYSAGSGYLSTPQTLNLYLSSR